MAGPTGTSCCKIVASTTALLNKTIAVLKQFINVEITGVNGPTPAFDGMSVTYLIILALIMIGLIYLECSRPTRTEIYSIYA